jgi:PiT family inorganic phosphate transporter
MHLLGQSLDASQGVFLVVALGLALSFEFVNGFHDTANAVATVIYTHTLRPWVAVVWSGICNLIGVLTSSGAVAFGIVSLLPVELVINVGSGPGFAMVFALLISAIIWNLGTWSLGLPASSSHTLVGSIMGVGLANSLMAPGHHLGAGVNWAQAGNVGLTLLVSPIVGFVCSGLLLLLAKALIKIPSLYTAPTGNEPPPGWIRGLLMLTCTGVSFAHGSNDGQKGMGLLMLILVGILPSSYALKMNADSKAIQQIVASANAAEPALTKDAGGVQIDNEAANKELGAFLKTDGKASDKTFAAAAMKSKAVSEKLNGKNSFNDVSAEQRKDLRSDIYLTGSSLQKLAKQGKFADAQEAASMTKYGKSLDSLTKFIPDWVKFAVALALGLGTMIGWKRIVVTVGEKIGKSHLTYGQGASAELVAMCTILAADWFGLPVSTTHVLSSGVAGTMAANRSGLQADTLRNILLAWVLTLPVCVLLGATLFAFGLFIVFNVLGLH